MDDTPPRSTPETILIDALAQPPEQRRAFVERACADDAGLTGHILSLLRGYEEQGNLLEKSPAAREVATIGRTVSSDDVSAGDRVGRYRLLERIGEGATAVVFMAEQYEPVRRRVALKLIKLGLDTRDLIARFEVERQALALMEHPNIARVFDAGATDRGRPYFVMELVRGVPITQYCDDVRLEPRARLELFIQVCEAVQHAHQKGVIHRDLKPSNILVTVNDGVPVPKVIDFGIAKATQGRLTDHTVFTRFHAFVGTPGYASPEQVELTSVDVDTRSDVYSLGVLLYELLTGRRPIDANTLERLGIEEMRRAIREFEPARPSVRVNSLDPAGRTETAARRGVDAARLVLLLSDDLDWIVMHCLEKDRVRRYETASALAQDVRRFLRNETVLARPPSLGYRVSRFVRRHRVPVIAAATVAVALVGGLVASTAFFLRERTARERAVEAEHDQVRMRREAEVAREIERRRSSRTSLELAGQLLERDRVAEALAHLVHAARKDPGNLAIAPRLASVLTSHRFLVPQRAPFPCGARVLAMRYSLDGRFLHVGCDDGTFRVFEATSGRLAREFRLGRNVRRRGWAFAANNDACFAVCFEDGDVGVFDAATGEPRWRPVGAGIELNPDSGVGGAESVGLSPDGRWLWAAGWQEIRLWDAATGRTVLQRAFAEWCFGPSFTSDGGRLALVHADTLHVWNLPELTPAFDPVPIAGRAVPGVFLVPHFSPDDRLLAVCDPAMGIHVFDAGSGVRSRFLPSETGFDFSTAGFLPDGRFFSAHGGGAELVDLRSGATTPLPFGFPWVGHCVRVGTPDGRHLLTASSDGVARLWDATSGRAAAQPALRLRMRFCAALARDGSQIVIGGDSGAIHWLRADRGAAQPLVLVESPRFGRNPSLPGLPARVLDLRPDEVRTIDVASGRIVPGGFALSDSQRAVLAAMRLPWIEYREDVKFALVRDNGSGQPALAWQLSRDGNGRFVPLEDGPCATPGITGTSFSRFRDRVAHARSLTEVGVWDLHTGRAVGPFCSYGDRPLSLYPGIELSPDGTRLAGSPFEGRVVAIWDVETGRIVTRIRTGSSAACQVVRFSPDGERLVTLDARHEARLWNARDGEPLSPVLAGNDASDVRFSPDGRYFATRGSHEVVIWDGRSGSFVSRLAAGAAADLQFSHDGRSVATYDGRGIVRVWDVERGEPMTEAVQHALPARILDGFSDDDTFLVVLAGERTGCVWAVPPRLPEGGAIPEWLLQLATICSAMIVDEAGRCVDVPEVVEGIDDVRRELAQRPDNAPLVAWGRWFLDDSPDRPIAPGFTITPAEARRLAEESGPAAPK